MTWPNDDLTDTNFDQGTDDPSLARAELNALLLKVQAILAEVTPGNKVFHDQNGVSANTFIPVLTGSGGTAGGYSVQDGYYYRIGDLVYVTLRVALTSKGTLSGVVGVNLPFTVKNISAMFGGQLHAHTYNTTLGLTYLHTPFIQLVQNTSIGNVWYGEDDAGSLGLLDWSNCAATFQLSASGIYLVE